MSAQNIPQTDSIQELAQFWDTHDLSDFEAELEEVTEPVFERETPLTIHLCSEDAQAIKELAKSKGISDTELVREWVAEKVHSL